ncbi:MAG: hypothetical protein Q8K12_14165 [Thiobacillus sp.]|nr:hypothetical protein [Thiobacillus sp.]
MLLFIKEKMPGVRVRLSQTSHDRRGNVVAKATSTQNAVIPAKAGIQRIKNPRASVTTSLFCPLRGGVFSCWIPAFAGMTANGLFGLKVNASSYGTAIA